MATGPIIGGPSKGPAYPKVGVAGVAPSGALGAGAVDVENSNEHYADFKYAHMFQTNFAANAFVFPVRILGLNVPRALRFRQIQATIDSESGAKDCIVKLKFWNAGRLVLELIIFQNAFMDQCASDAGSQWLNANNDIPVALCVSGFDGNFASPILRLNIECDQIAIEIQAEFVLNNSYNVIAHLSCISQRYPESLYHEYNFGTTTI